MAAFAGGDLSRATNSKGSGRSQSVRDIWQGPSDVFTRNSTRREMVDDEDELKWAAIEGLPTYDRMRKGMLKQVVDVTNLHAQDKEQLMESILKVVEDHNQRALRKLCDQNDRVGIEISKIEVRFQNLAIEGDAYVCTRALPTLWNSTLNTLEAAIGMVGLCSSKKKVVNILQNVTEIIKPSSCLQDDTASWTSCFKIDHPVFSTECACNPNQSHCRMAELLFNYYGVPSIESDAEAPEEKEQTGDKKIKGPSGNRLECFQGWGKCKSKFRVWTVEGFPLGVKLN